MVKNLLASAEDGGSTPGSGTCPREGNDNPLQYSRPESPMYRGCWRAMVHGITKERRHDLVTKQQQKTLKQQSVFSNDSLHNPSLHFQSIFLLYDKQV